MYKKSLSTNPSPDNELKNKAAIVLQRTYRRHRAGHKILQNYADEDFQNQGLKKRVSQKKRKADLEKDNPFAKRSVPLIRTVYVLKAITEFKQLRVQRKYLDNDNIDMIDVGIKTIDIQSDVTRLNKRMDGLEVKMDAILEKLDKL